MRNLVIMLAVGAFFLGLALSASPALASPAYEDPQLCVNGKLLRVDPTTAPIEVWVEVGSNLTVDYVVTNCGGDPNLPVVDPSHVSVGGGRNEMEVTVQTEPKAKVVFNFDGRAKTVKANRQGWAEFETKVR
ncbi:MAG: hypothetical protein HY741_00220 [Chloroflexi bacterium]|nr:hypothetical protein [Chloroflexota bacterium]